jgi:hypothetical protein
MHGGDPGAPCVERRASSLFSNTGNNNAEHADSKEKKNRKAHFPMRVAQGPIVPLGDAPTLAAGQGEPVKGKGEDRHTNKERGQPNGFKLIHWGYTTQKRAESNQPSAAVPFAAVQVA